MPASAIPLLRFVVSVVAGGAAAGALAAVIGYPILRLRGAYFSIAMLGVSLVLGELSNSVDLFEGALGITLDPGTSMAPEVLFYYLFLGLAALAFVVGGHRALFAPRLRAHRHSRGRGHRAHARRSHRASTS